MNPQSNSKDNFRVAMLGAGVAGVAAALAVARLGYSVDIYEKYGEALLGSSNRTPGRAGHGFHYIDPATGKLYLNTVIQVLRNFPGSLIGASEPDDKHFLHHGLYVIMKHPTTILHDMKIQGRLSDHTLKRIDNLFPESEEHRHLEDNEQKFLTDTQKKYIGHYKKLKRLEAYMEDKMVTPTYKEQLAGLRLEEISVLSETETLPDSKMSRKDFGRLVLPDVNISNTMLLEVPIEGKPLTREEFDEIWQLSREIKQFSSLFPENQIFDTYEQLRQHYEIKVSQDPKNKFFGDPEQFLKIYRSDSKKFAEYKEAGVINLQHAAAVVDTREELLNWPVVREQLLKRISTNDKIRLYVNTTITKVDINPYTQRYQIHTKDGHIFEADSIGNSTWENIEFLSRRNGEDKENQHDKIKKENATKRLKVIVTAKLPEVLRKKPSTFIAMGAHCMFSNMNDGRGMMTYALTTNMKSFTDDIDPQTQSLLNGEAPLALKEKLGEEVKQGVGQYIPAMLDAEILEVGFGIIRTEEGSVDVFDPGSRALHTRNHIGVTPQEYGWINNASLKLLHFVENGHVFAKIFKEQLYFVMLIQAFNQSARATNKYDINRINNICHLLRTGRLAILSTNSRKKIIHDKNLDMSDMKSNLGDDRKTQFILSTSNSSTFLTAEDMKKHYEKIKDLMLIKLEVCKLLRKQNGIDEADEQVRRDEKDMNFTGRGRDNNLIEVSDAGVQTCKYKLNGQRSKREFNDSRKFLKVVTVLVPVMLISLLLYYFYRNGHLNEFCQSGHPFFGPPVNSDYLETSNIAAELVNSLT